MGASGTTTIDFGSYPGRATQTKAVTGQISISSSSVVEAWLYPVATADHSADEHWVDGPLIYAGGIVAGTGFTIYGTPRTQFVVNDPPRVRLPEFYTAAGHAIQLQPVPYGLWTVAWVWV